MMNNDIRAAETASETAAPAPAKKQTKGGLPALPGYALSLVLLVVLGITLLGGDSTPDIALPTDLNALSTEEQSVVRGEVLEALADLMVLPDDTEPVLAVVSDAETLRAQQAFYAKAEDGDALLIFQLSQQAVIYRPGEHKIVNAGSLVLNQ